MLGKKHDERSNSERPIYVFTIDQLPGRQYQALGLVRKTETKLGSSRIGELIKDLQDQTRQLGGDAILGFRLETFNEGHLNVIFAYGTAVVYTDKDTPGDSD